MEEGRSEATRVSHDSQRSPEMGCAKRLICVKSAVGGAWSKWSEKTGYAQRSLCSRWRQRPR